MRKENQSENAVRSIFECEYPEEKYSSKEAADGAVLSDMRDFCFTVGNDAFLQSRAVKLPHRITDAVLLCISLTETFHGRLSVQLCEESNTLKVLLCAKSFDISGETRQKLKSATEYAHGINISCGNTESGCIIAMNFFF